MTTLMRDDERDALSRELDAWKSNSKAQMNQLDLCESELALARAVVEASRQIRAFYPGGKLVWFDQFSAFETALAAYDAIREGKPCAPS